MSGGNGKIHALRAAGVPILGQRRPAPVVMMQLFVPVKFACGCEAITGFFVSAQTEPFVIEARAREIIEQSAREICARCKAGENQGVRE